MNMKRICVLCVVLYFLFSSENSWSQGPSRLTLADAVKTAIANNLEVQQSGLQAETDEINWKQAKLNLLPNLNGNVDNGISSGRSIDPSTNSYSTQKITYSSYGLSSNVTLFNGFSLRNRVKQNELAYQASSLDWQQLKDNLTISIILAFLDILNNEDQLQQLRNQAELTKKQLDRLIILDSSGAIAPSLVSDMKGQLATDQLAIINMQSNIETAKIYLAQQMNMPYDKSLQLERAGVGAFLEKYTGSSEIIYQAALENYPQLKANELRRQSAAKAITVAKGEMFPTLSLGGTANSNYSNAARNDLFINTTEVVSSDYVTVNGNKIPVVRLRDNYSSLKIPYGKQINNNLATSLNLNLRIPIFNSFQARNRVRLAQIDLKNSQLVAGSAKTQLQQFIEQAYVNMNTAWERYKVLIDQVNAYKESFRAAEIRFNAGLGNSVDYLTAKNNLDRAMSNIISVKYDYLLRTKVLDYYQGRLAL